MGGGKSQVCSGVLRLEKDSRTGLDRRKGSSVAFRRRL